MGELAALPFNRIFLAIEGFCKICKINLTTVDVYDSLPTIVTTFVTIIAKLTIFIFILDLVHYANGPKSEFTWTDILRGDLGNHLMWDKLSNSGDSLKLLIPTSTRKAWTGWTNHSGKVTTQKISKMIIGNHGSKSNLIVKFVKEQRVYGSWHTMCLRSTLMGFKRNYQIRILSNQINKTKSYTSIAKACYFSSRNGATNSMPNICESKSHILKMSSILLNAYFITGFTDGEGCFQIQISPSKTTKIGWMVQANFLICIHKKDRAILELIKSYFGGIGNIWEQGTDSVLYNVSSQQDLTNVIIPHFDKYLLITQNKADFLLFKKVVYLMVRKEHLTIKGLENIVAIRASVNWGLSDKLATKFSNVEVVPRPIVVNQTIKYQTG